MAFKYHNRLLFVFISLGYILLTACAEQYANPNIKCPSGRNNDEEMRHTYPSLVYPFNPDTPPHSMDELQTFCNEIKNHFAQSNLTTTQAQNIYKLLEANQNQFSSKDEFWFENRCDTVPDCVDTPFEMNKQVMLKKIRSTEIELFIYYMRCGFNYIHLKITIEANEITQITLIERWREKYTCRRNLGKIS